MAITPHSATETVKEVAYNARNEGLLAVGKKSAESAGGAIAVAIETPSIALLSTLGLMAAVSAGITQLEYGHERRRLRDFYKEEIAAKLGKDPKSVGDKDLEKLTKGTPAAEGNKTITEAVHKYRKHRNFGIVLSIAASLGTYGLVKSVIPAAAFAAFGTAPILGIGFLTGAMIASAVVGLLTYHAIKKPLHWVAHKAFGLDNDTAHDRIAEIQKDREQGKTISREQVFSVFVAANPELEDLIKNKYGKSFDKLDVAQKLRVTESIGKIIHIDQLTDSLNLGHIKVAELAFAAEGDISGVAPKSVDAHKTSLLATIKSKLAGLVHHVDKDERVVMEYAHEKPRRTFASRFSRADTALGHVERLDQSRGELPTVQR